MGLENIHSVAKDGGYILNIQLSDWEDDTASVQLPFQLGGRETNYSLQIHESDTFGTLESSLGADTILGLAFTTRDRDNDYKVNINCAKHLSGKFPQALKYFGQNAASKPVFSCFYRWLVVQ